LEGDITSQQFLFSTTEVKYITTIEAVKEQIWMRGLESDLDLQQNEIVVFSDRKG
jgi:hypothetical protein